MLYIKLTTGTKYTWQVGEPKPIQYDDVNDVQEIQADGHELIHIENMFHISPIPKGRVIRVFGDLAKIIIGNL